MTPLQRTRLDAALSALRDAGSSDREGHLIDRLRRAITNGKDGRWTAADVLAQARSWASIVREQDDGQKHAAARDAIGLLWAAMEDDDG